MRGFALSQVSAEALQRLQSNQQQQASGSSKTLAALKQQQLQLQEKLATAQQQLAKLENAMLQQQQQFQGAAGVALAAQLSSSGRTEDYGMSSTIDNGNRVCDASSAGRYGEGTADGAGAGMRRQSYTQSSSSRSTGVPAESNGYSLSQLPSVGTSGLGGDARGMSKKDKAGGGQLYSGACPKDPWGTLDPVKP